MPRTAVANTPPPAGAPRAAVARWLLRGAAAFLPLLVLVAAVNLTVDPANLFRRGYEHRAAEIVAGGQNAANLKNMDDRLFQRECAALLPYTPNTLVLGASRGLQISAAVTGCSTLFNAGVTNGDLRDMISLYMLYRSLGKTPRRVILMADYCLFNPEKLDDRAYTDGYEAFAARTGTQPLRTPARAADLARWGQLVSPAYFQASLAFIETGAWRQKDPVPTIAPEADTDMRRADGSYSYNLDFRSHTAAERMANGWTTAWDIAFNMGTYAENSPVLRTQFELFVAEMQADGTQVILLLPPINPYMYDLMVADPDYVQELALEAYFRAFAAENGIAVAGSYDARSLGLTEDDFYDALHCSMDATARYWPAELKGDA